MKTLDWPPNFVAKCPVRLFEAPGGGSSWMPSGTAGEFHMKPLGNAELHFQLRDLLNGSFRGFGFADIASANEMKKQVEKAVKPYHIKESVNGNPIKAPLDDVEISISHMRPEATTSSNKNFSKVITYESVPKRSKGVNKHRKDSVASSSVPSFEMTTFSSSPKSGTLRSKWKLILKGFSTLSPIKKLSAMSHVFGWREQEMEIGYPTDVKHVAHIGWDGPSVGGPNWVDELKPAPDFSSGPLREFGQPRDADWIHDAFSASKWSAPGLGEKFSSPPGAPTEFLGPDKAQLDQKEGYKWHLFGARKASKSIQKTQSFTSGTYT